MKQKLYCCNDSKHLYDDDYNNQQSKHNAIPVFMEHRYQCGHGLRQVIGRLIKCFVVCLVVPHTKQIGKQILGNVTKTRIKVVVDVMECRSMKEAIKKQGLNSKKRTVGKIMQQLPNFGNNDTAPKIVKQQQRQKKQEIKKESCRRMRQSHIYITTIKMTMAFVNSDSCKA